MPIGPVQILVIGFDEPTYKGKVREELNRLREHDIVRLIDMILVRKNADGEVERMQHSDLTPDEAAEFGAVVGALIGFGADGEEGGEVGATLGAAALGSGGSILDQSDSWFVDDVIPENSAAAIVLLEHRWAIPLRDALLDEGAFLLADAWVHPTDLVQIGLMLAEEAEAQTPA
jgi:uncharacterized membrane protein